MQQNVRAVDRALRISLGIALLLVAVLIHDEWGWIGLFGVVPLYTGMVGTCPLYSLFGVITRRMPKAKISPVLRGARAFTE